LYEGTTTLSRPAPDPFPDIGRDLALAAPIAQAEANVQEPLFFFDRDSLLEKAREHRDAYRGAAPFPHAVIDDFLPEPVVRAIVDEFPDRSAPRWHRFDEPRQKKLASSGEAGLGPLTRHVLAQFNSAAFLSFLEELTGIERLVADPWFEGGGLHQIVPGGLLKVHVDFSRHARTGLYRRLNVLLYLNDDWRPEWGGNLELWNADVSRCERSVVPFLNRLALFETSDISYHGHPDPLACPDDRTRKSMALYYYTPDPPAAHAGAEHSTVFRRRPGERIPVTIRELGEQLCPPIVLNAFERITRRRA
jgi:hypothetical protein